MTHTTSQATIEVTTRGKGKKRKLVQTIQTIAGSLISDDSSVELPDGEAYSRHDSVNIDDKDRLMRNIQITEARSSTSTMVIINRTVKEKIRKEVKWIDLDKESTSFDKP